VATRSNSILPSVAAAIGDTPLVELSRLTRGLEGRILAKLEFLNPGFSKKDRIARQMIEEAEQQGALKPGQTVVELTSGNTGTGLAIVCAVTGHPFVAVMSKGNSVERARMMTALGAEVVLVDQAPGSRSGQVSGEDLALVEARARELVEQRGAFRADQFTLAANPNAHALHTAQEILHQTGSEFDAFCDYVGSGGTFAGCARAFKAHDRGIACYVVEPAACAVLAGKTPTNPNHRLQGGGYSMPDLSLLDRRHVDGYLQVTDAEAIDAARKLARVEGLFAGFSSGANVAAAMQLLRGPHRGGTIVVLLPDSGLKYLSTDLWPE
jgi:cysteine synthase